MPKIFQKLGLGSALKGDIGIEIECEGNGLVGIPRDVNDYWHTEVDNSLRGDYPFCAAEYVLNQPIMFKEVAPALKNLSNVLAASELNFSFRTSVHVHVNVQDMEEDAMLALVYTYLLLEEPLLNYCGRERKGNRFCLRLQDAEGIMGVINTLIDKGTDRLFGYYTQDMIRYASLNLAALQKYGSVEFRGMRGTLDQGVLNNWIGSLFSLKKYAKDKTIKDVYNHFVDAGPEQFMEDVLKDYAKVFTYAKVEQDLMTSFSLSIDLIRSYELAVEARKPPLPAKKKAPTHAENWPALPKRRGVHIPIGQPFEFRVDDFFPQPIGPEQF